MQDDEYEVVLGSDDKNVYFYLTNCYQIRCKKIYSKKWQNQMWQISKRLKKDRCFALGYLQMHERNLRCQILLLIFCCLTRKFWQRRLPYLWHKCASLCQKLKIKARFNFFIFLPQSAFASPSTSPLKSFSQRSRFSISSGKDLMILAAFLDVRLQSLRLNFFIFLPLFAEPTQVVVGPQSIEDDKLISLC